MKNELESRDSVTAFRMLHCLSVSKRPLRQHELLDAVSFVDQHAVLDTGYRLWDNATDLCKPLVEVTGTGLVKFVHFTAKESVTALDSQLIETTHMSHARYLVDSANCFAISPSTAHYDMTVSCVTYLQLSFDLIDGRILESEKESRVLNSLFGFHSYATMHWLEHLLAYGQCFGGLHNAPDSSLNTLVINLMLKQDEIRVLLDPDRSAVGPALSHDVFHAQSFLQQCYAFQEELKRRKGDSGEGKAAHLVSLSFSRLTLRSDGRFAITDGSHFVQHDRSQVPRACS